MRTFLVGLVLACVPAAAPAQSPDRAIALETGLSAARSGAGLALALSTSGWLEGPVDWTATLGWASAPRTTGRRADPGGAGWATAGLRASTGDRLRLSAGLEVGAASEAGRVGAAAGGSVGLGVRLGALTLGARAGARRGPERWRTEVLVGLEAAY